jgi:formylglycine-generating enzyme
MIQKQRAFVSVGIVSLGISCRSDPTTPPSGTPPASRDVAIAVVIDATDGWTVTVDGASCTHVAVRKACSRGLCRIPAGCFLQGSPADEQTRGENAEPLAPITLTHAFEIGETEVTVEEWSRFFPSLPNNRPGSKPERTCVEARCPVTHTTWFDALSYANQLSATASPPLPACYELSSCSGEVGRGLVCATVTLTVKTIYDCTGFRLPTYAEWEYATRAGSRTTVYSGNLLPVQGAGERFFDPNLDAIAWYGWNSSMTSRVVAQKLANAWGIYDTMGNVFEFVNDRYRSHFSTGPQTDPGAFLDGQFLTDPRSVRGCAFYSSNAYSCRSAAALSATPSGDGMPYGFRIARTVF